MKRIKTILMGTSEFAERIFTNFYQRLNFDIAAVVTTPDKPAGRKQKLLPSPVKKFAEENKLPVFDFEHIKDPQSIDKIKELNPDLIILCAYGQIVPKEILEIPKYGALNIHPSLLPKYRGASPIHAAILNGDKISGVTIMLMDEKMDHGDIISNFKFQISKPKITYKELEDKLIDVSADLLIKTLPNWIEGKIKAQAQDHSKATFCKIIKKQDGKIDWNKSAEEIERTIRAFHQWPTSYTFFNNKQLKVLGADTKEDKIKMLIRAYDPCVTCAVH
ncbi:MAG TPA: methionyl-tRNA formyltransferase [bacterium]|nr:methionyl-tRNA formyltransferase [bacterium]